MSDPVEAPWERRARRFGPVLIAACALLAYANSFYTPFVFDGANYLRDNEKLQTLWPPHELLSIAPTRPVAYITFGLNYQLAESIYGAGTELVSWHATNLAIHIFAAWALFGIARRTFLTPRLVGRFGSSAARLATAIALLWVVHPLCTQSVTYLYQRLESLMGMFYLWSLYSFVRYAASSQARWGAAAVICCLLSMATKEVAVTLPIMAVWYDRVFIAESWREVWGSRRGLLHAALVVSLVLPTAMMTPVIFNDHYKNAGILDTDRIGVVMYARTQPEIVLHYLRLSFVPYGLNIDYGWPGAKTINWPATIAILALGFGTIWAMFRAPAVGFLGGWWFVILGPTSSFAPIIDLAFEHRTYLSLIAPLALAACCTYRVVGRAVARLGGESETAAAVRGGLLAVAVAVLTALTLLRNHDYRSALSLWADAAEKAPWNARAHYNHGVYLQIAGSDEEIDAAIEEYHATLEIDPNYADAYLNLGNLAVYRKQFADAERYFTKLVELRPHDAKAQELLKSAREQRAKASETP